MQTTNWPRTSTGSKKAKRLGAKGPQGEHINRGGAGSRTQVRKNSSNRVYVRSTNSI